MTTDREEGAGFALMARLVERGAMALVYFGGFCLIAATVLTSLSILGSLVIRPLPGEIEVVEALCGLAVFAFLPYCHLNRGHVGVDILIAALGKRAMAITQIAGDIAIAVLFVLLAWRHWLGTADKFANGETTTILALPLWWGYAVAFVLLCANVLAGLYVLVRDLREISGRSRPSLAAGGHG